MPCNSELRDAGERSSPLATARRGCAMFDLDGTILAGDSTGRWILRRLRGSPMRILATLVVALPAVLLLAVPSCRKIGGSVLLWVASVGLDATALRASFAEFAEHMDDGAHRAWRRGALGRLSDHLGSGDPVIVVTAAPVELAQAVIAKLGYPVTVVGSRLRKFAGGWVLADHCRHRRKCSALAEAGYGEGWAFAYTDSLDDLPLLDRAGRSFVINPGNRARHFLQRHRPATMVLRW